MAQPLFYLRTDRIDCLLDDSIYFVQPSIHGHSFEISFNET